MIAKMCRTGVSTKALNLTFDDSSLLVFRIFVELGILVGAKSKNCLNFFKFFFFGGGGGSRCVMQRQQSA
jgi:hypothetical protein